jgi:hypothetical protein
MRSVRSNNRSFGLIGAAMVMKTTKITIETESLLVVHKGRTFETWCASCCAQTEAMALEGDSFCSEISSQLLRDWLAAGMVHLWITEGGQTLICLASLLRCLKSDSPRALPNSRPNYPKAGDQE